MLRSHASKLRLAGWAWEGAVLVLKTLFIALMIATPVAGVWIASSLAALVLL